ncbi:MAG: 2-oxoacid:acceptor oxidoreductase family protein [Candidatus Woesearchaeota archaeon]
MIEIKCIGRGGQGAVTFSQILAIAAFEEGYPVVQAMPNFGVERRGAPAFSFTRLSKEQCFGIRSQIYTPDYVVVLDPSLMSELDVTEGLKKKGLLIINTNKKITKKDAEVHIVDASSVALKLFKKDIVNTAMLGAFAAATKLVSLESLYKGVEQRFKGNQKLIDLNKKAIKEVYNKLK